MPEYQEAVTKLQEAQKDFEASPEYQAHQAAIQKLKEKEEIIEEAKKRAMATPEHTAALTSKTTQAQTALEATKAYKEWQELTKTTHHILLPGDHLPEKIAEVIAYKALTDTAQWNELQACKGALARLRMQQVKASNAAAAAASSS